MITYKKFIELNEAAKNRLIDLTRKELESALIDTADELVKNSRLKKKVNDLMFKTIDIENIGNESDKDIIKALKQLEKLKPGSVSKVYDINEAKKLSLFDLQELIDTFEKEFKGNVSKIKRDPRFKELSKDSRDFVLDELK